MLDTLVEVAFVALLCRGEISPCLCDGILESFDVVSVFELRFPLSSRATGLLLSKRWWVTTEHEREWCRSG